MRFVDFAHPAAAEGADALDISDGKQMDVWVYDWARDTLPRLTFDPADDQVGGTFRAAT